MKNKELIEKLQALDPEAEVITASSNFELRGAKLQLVLYTNMTKVVKKLKHL